MYKYKKVDKYEVVQWAITKLIELETLKKFDLKNLDIKIDFYFCFDFLKKLIENPKEFYYVLKNDNKIVSILNYSEFTNKTEVNSFEICSYDDFQDELNFIKTFNNTKDFEVKGFIKLKPSNLRKIIVD